MAVMKFVDREGYSYVMYVRHYECYDVRGVLLCFDSTDPRLTDPDPMLFNALIIDTRFGILVDESVYCDPHYVDNVLAYICDNREQIRSFLGEYMSETETDRFLEQLHSVHRPSIEPHERISFHIGEDVPKLALGTARKRFFILNEAESYEEVGFPTAVSIYGREAIIEKCKQLNYLNGVGLNGRAIWLDGIGIQDIDRDGYHGGWCR